MIEINFRGICKACPRAVLNLDYTDTGVYGETTRTWTVKCEHEEICKIWHEKVTNLMSVVRCMDCKWCDVDEEYDEYFCRNWADATDADGFCHEGEMRKQF